MACIFCSQQGSMGWTALLGSLVVCTMGLAACSDDIAAKEAVAEEGNEPGMRQPPGLLPPLRVRLVPQAGVAGMQRINFAVPLPPGMLQDERRVRVLHAGRELAAARRALARHPDGSMRSIQIQVEVGVAGEDVLEVHIGQEASPAQPLRPVAETLRGAQGPRVWALLPAQWLSWSQVAGPLLPEAEVAGTPLDAWSRVCDYARYNTDAFLRQSGDAAAWLFDRPTAFYRGYARRGDLLTLESAYREASLYRERLMGQGDGLRIGVPGRADDLKYHYTQGMALHYLLTGDDRFREAAEAVAARAAVVWPDPSYDGGTRFWTERHAGFALLAFVWAMIVSDDRAAVFRALADRVVSAVIAVQETYPRGYTDREARCFAHSAQAHGESFGYFGCSPWMSAILADGLDAYARERGGAEAGRARTALVKLARILARDGRDARGKPYYWMGVGNGRNEIDPYDEHWGEAAYVVALGYYHQGRTDSTLRRGAEALVSGLRTFGVAPHLRSFNWQCRSAVATPFFLR